MKPRKTSIKSIKTNKVVTCDPKDKIAKVWVKMEDTGFSGMPVVKKKKVIGMITRGDILSSGTKTSASVEKVMKTPAITVNSNAKVEDALKLMLKHNIGRLPVVQKNRLVGIIDRENILEAWLY
jgi:CBS domain-containing protein